MSDSVSILDRRMAWSSDWDGLATVAWKKGGYYGKPGPVVMLQGWLEFQAMKRGAHLMLPPRDNQSDV
ncbi:hypothetical protein DCM78_18820 [Bradyrhizobium sp. WBOS04]|nr:hypothetical protein DCM78_11810 [Bradyrhizobium sp. WBOS04]UUO61167.1 hypothetical protein DCM80_19550 [Bradyrhizobium sp. WBOS08]UUO48121.1 hypothetical protein DCM78_15045 [Bradyrhizobium sp. WBOS04]UUO48783.1 hypothetical protein DCM78_18820 [Bradyrhizobium sp. WBOS04]UUO61367.1 hypothetical protein DCM80_20680 [Bradyrhizobium sp. WBOS08]